MGFSACERGFRRRQLPGGAVPVRLRSLVILLEYHGSRLRQLPGGPGQARPPRQSCCILLFVSKGNVMCCVLGKEALSMQRDVLGGSRLALAAAGDCRRANAAQLQRRGVVLQEVRDHCAGSILTVRDMLRSVPLQASGCRESAGTVRRAAGRGERQEGGGVRPEGGRYYGAVPRAA